jgi:hypothetical protein
MKLIYVDTKLPERRRKKHLQELIEAFCESGREVAKIDWTTNEYKNANSCFSSMHKAIVMSKRPVKVVKIGDEVYLTKI